MAKAHRSLPSLVEASATAPEGVCAAFRDEHVFDTGAEINIRRWDELSDEDMSNWRSLWQRARERPELLARLSLRARPRGFRP